MTWFARGRQRRDHPGFRPIQLIGQDAIGHLWQATDSFTGVPVAIKIVRQSIGSNPVFVERFGSYASELMCPVVVEGKLSLRLSHPNVARLIEFREGDAASRPIFVMESLQGRLLADVLRERGPLRAKEIARIGFQVAEGINAVHQADLVHGGVHPGNILLSPRGGAVSMDLGVIEALLFAGETAALEDLSPYLAPEVAAGANLTPSSDVFSLGTLLRTMGTASTPGRYVPGIPQAMPLEMTRAFQEARALDPRARPSMAALQSVLLRFMDDPEIHTSRP